jgi:hypothetical protein
MNNLKQNPANKPNVNDVYAMASLCPTKNGAVVFNARILYKKLTGSNEVFSDICTESGLLRTNKKPNKTIVAEPLAINIKLYPNPVTDVLFIELQNLKNYTITDITGKVILTQKSNGMGIENIEVNTLNNGVYFIKLSQKDNTIITQKFVKW